nr:p8 [Lettuce chlorosis virus]
MILYYPVYCDKNSEAHSKPLCSLYITLEWFAFVLLFLALLLILIYGFCLCSTGLCSWCKSRRNRVEQRNYSMP